MALFNSMEDLLKATRPPAGTYDPSLDAEEAAAQRGLSDLESDTALGSSRALTNYGIGQQALNTQKSRGLADIATQRGYNTEDYSTGNQYRAEDYARSTQGLARQYQNMAIGQAQSQRTLGDVSSGTSAQSARKRAANQAWDQAPIDTNFNRANIAATSQYNRANVGYDTAAQRLGENTDTGLANLALNYGRGQEDAQNTLAKAQREGQFFSQDVSANRFWQALQSGTWPIPDQTQQ